MHRITSSPAAEPGKNRLCRDLGHDWKLSPSGTFRICARACCQASEQLAAGRWHNARPSRKSLRAHVPLVGRPKPGGHS